MRTANALITPSHFFSCNQKSSVLYSQHTSTGKIARILLNETADYLKTSGCHVVNEKLLGRLFPDQVKLEEILRTYKQ